MNYSRLEKRIHIHEGFRANAYLDTVGKLTIGYGRNIQDVGISEPEATHLCENDIDRAIEGAETLLPPIDWKHLTDLRREVLVEMVFQMGLPRVLGFVNMIAALREYDYALAADEMLDSRWHEQTPARCEDLARMMRYGIAAME